MRGTFKTMGSLFKMPKYEPPKQVETSNKLLDEREARADANEQREKRKSEGETKKAQLNIINLFN